MRKFFRYWVLSVAAVVAMLGFPIPGHSQSNPKRTPMWKEARRPAAKGTRISLPSAILKQIEAEHLSPVETREEPQDPCNSKERAKLTAYRVSLRGRREPADVFVRAANFCYCGATGNCLFWVFRASGGRYNVLLRAKNVQDFGLLNKKTLGYRDLVIWAHDSADRSPARLYQFDGKEYEEACGWEEDYEFKKLSNGRWVSIGDPKIVDSSCEQVPSSEESKP